MKIWIFILTAVIGLTGCLGTKKDEGKEATAQTAPTAQVNVEESHSSSQVNSQPATNSSPTETDKNNKEQNTTSTETSDEKGKTSSETNPNPASLAPASAAEEEPKQTVLTESAIQEKYKSQLLSLQNYYSGKLSNLYNGAVEDWKGKKLSKKDIYSKYSGVASQLKEESQAKVNQLLSAMKDELKGNGYPTESVDHYRSEYYSVLDQAKGQALEQVKKALGI